MEIHIVPIRTIEKVTHDVLRVVTDKPPAYSFTPGQATDVSVNKPGWQHEKRPFTFTCLPDQDYLEFTIKTYPSHNGVTNQLLQLQKGDELILHEVFGDISFKGEGIFIAGGAGVTPFISIFRDLQKKNAVENNKLIFANKTRADIILEDEFKNLLGNRFINILSDEKIDGYANGFITGDFLQATIDNFNKYFYVCGPPAMMDAVEKILANLRVDKACMIKEAF
jgi:ferredoxin-NADP reductase